MTAQFEGWLEFNLLPFECLHEYFHPVLNQRNQSRLLFKFLQSRVLDEILNELELTLETLWDQFALVLDVGLYLIVDRESRSCVARKSISRWNLSAPLLCGRLRRLIHVELVEIGNVVQLRETLSQIQSRRAFVVYGVCDQQWTHAVLVIVLVFRMILDEAAEERQYISDFMSEVGTNLVRLAMSSRSLI